MTTFATGNPVPSTAVKDLYDNAENFDVAVNSTGQSWTDRLGVLRLSWKGIETQFAQFLISQGFQYLGDYSSGAITIGAPNQVFSRNGNYYRPGPSLVLPYTTVSNWTIDGPKFLVAGDGVLRNELTSNDLDKGISLLPGGQRIVSTVAVLKTMPSTTPAREVKISRYRTGGPVINTEYEADFSDLTTVANDFDTIRTAAGLLYRLKHTGWATYQAAGAIGDDVTNDADAMDRFNSTNINLAGIGKFMTSRGLNFPSPTGRAIKGVPGQFKVRSQANTNHEVTFRSVNPVGLRIENMEVDANSYNRTGVLTTRTIALDINSGTDCQIVNCTGRNAIGSGAPSLIPGVGIATSGAGIRVDTYQCHAFDCGVPGKAADGFFCSSEYSKNDNNTAIRCADTGHVVDSVNYSGISNFTSIDCGVGAALANAYGADIYGQYINGGVIRNWSAEVTGGVQILCAGSGNLIDATVTGLTMTAVSNGLGPAININETGTGRIIGLTLDHPRIRGRAGTTQGILGSGKNIEIIGPVVSGTDSTCIQFSKDSTVNITGGTLTGGVHSISSEGTARVIATGTVCETPAGYCMYAFGTSSIIYNAIVPINPGVGYAGKDSGATLSVFGGLGGGLTLAAAVVGAAGGSQSSKFPVYGPNGVTLGFVPLYPT